jgi:hypothetical protein
MNVAKEHHEDRSAPDEDGMLEWEYVYDVYTFSEGEATLRFRKYADEPTVATLLNRSWKQLLGLRSLLDSATQYLLAHEGISAIHAYNPARGIYSRFEEAAQSAASSGMISAEDANGLVGCVREVDAV